MKSRALLQVFLSIVLVIVQPLMFAMPTWASILTSANLTLTNQYTSTSSNQTLEFVTPTGVDASSDTIVVKYESGFNLSSLSSPGDFDLAVDNDSACNGPFVDKTLAVSAAAGTWGVGVSGQIVTFTAPSDAGAGEISSSRCIQIQIGTNASGGVGQITNPGLLGSYEVDVYGTFGDQAMYAVGIQTASPFNVTAAVPAPTTSTPPPTLPGDTTAPSITNIVVSNITTTSATISWSTNEPTQTTLLYGLNTSYSMPSMADSSFRTVHTRAIGGLTQATLYHFKIDAVDLSGNAGSSSDLTFSTLDVTAPIITNLQVTSITETTAVVSWDTDELSDSVVTGSFGTVTNSTMVTTHSVALTGLTEATAYPITVTSTDPSGNQSSSTGSFVTLADLPPTNVSGFTAVAGDGEVLLSWTNPTDTDFTNVSIRVNIGSYPTSITDGTEIFNGSTTSYLHTGLSNGTEYFYTIFAIDAGGNVSSGANQSVTPLETAPPIIIPPPTSTSLAISNLVVSNITQTTATVTWTTTAPASSSAVIPGVGTFVDSTLDINHRLNLTGLRSGTTYSLTASSTDASSSTATATTTFRSLSNVVVVTPVSPVSGTGTDADSDADDGIGADSDETPGSDTDEQNIEVVPPVPEVLIERSAVQFLVARDAIELKPTSNNVVRVLGGRGLAVNMSLKGAPSEITSVQLKVGADSYLMSQETNIIVGTNDEIVEGGTSELYSARVITANSDEKLLIHINYITGERQTIEYSLDVQPDGSIKNATDDSLKDATVTLFNEDGGSAIWNAIPFAQINPQITNDNGLYAWYVPDGTYKVTAYRSGHKQYTSAKITIADNIINLPIVMIELLPPIAEEIKSVGDIYPVLKKRVINSVQVVRQNPAVQDSVAVAGPVVAITAVSTVAVLATSFNAFRFLQYLFTAPFLLFKRRKRKKWGVVYDSLRKLPVDLAIVRLVDSATNRPLKSQVTDRAGRFMFVVEPGTYKIEVRKEGLVYPTSHLKDLKVDGDYLDLYHGENIVVKDYDSAIAVNIPVDPVGKEMVVSKKEKFAKWSRRLMYALSVLGVVVAVFVALVDTSPWTISLAVTQAIVLALFVKLARPRKPTSWGIVYNEKTRRPLSNAIVRIFDPKYNKLLETKVTDSRGRYAFLVGPSEFYTTYQKPGYQKVEVRPIDRTDTKQPSYVSINVPLASLKTP